MARAAREIPATVTEVDVATGKETHRAQPWSVVQPPVDCCQICAMRHAAAEPHNAQSLFYQMTFAGMIGRTPTWADALAHCSAPVRAAWEAELRRRGVWTAPPTGEAPVEHHGIG